MLRTAGEVLKALQVIGVIAAFPAIEGLWGDAKVVAGEAGIVTMRVIVIEPFKSLPGLFR